MDGLVGSMDSADPLGGRSKRRALNTSSRMRREVKRTMMGREDSAFSRCRRWAADMSFIVTGIPNFVLHKSSIRSQVKRLFTKCEAMLPDPLTVTCPEAMLSVSLTTGCPESGDSGIPQKMRLSALVNVS